MGNCHPEKTIVDGGEAEVVIGFRGVTIFHVTFSCSQYLLYYTECQSNTSSTLRLVSKKSRSSEYLSLYFVLRKRSEYMVNRTRINSAQLIFFGISPVVKQYHPFPSTITCTGVVS